MSLKIFIIKYKAQLKAMLPGYDKEKELCVSSPFGYNRDENARLSFVCISDTHLSDSRQAQHNLENLFKDIFNQKNIFDALLVAGDIADYGLKKEYARFFSVCDRYKDKISILLTMGNHDARTGFRKNSEIIMKKAREYLKLPDNNKTYYSYEINGYRFIVLSTEKNRPLAAYVSRQQLRFLDRQLKEGTAKGNPCFLMCHQPLPDTHGLPEVCRNGHIGRRGREAEKIINKYKNVFFINGHLHGGIFEQTAETVNIENNIHSLSIPSYRKPNNFGLTDAGIGYYCHVYDDKVVFKARNFMLGKDIEGDFTEFIYPVI